MSAFPPGRRALAALTATYLAALAPTVADSRMLDGLATPDPDRETAAPADGRLTSACQTGARERLGPGRLEFARPSQTSRDGVQILRIDVTAAGQAFRAVCTRDRTGAVETVVFAAPLDEVGPRVIVLGGATPEMRPRSNDPGYRIVARDPNQPDGYGPFDLAYTGIGLPGLWYDGDRFQRRHFDHDSIKRRTTPHYAEDRRSSSAPFASGGIASPGIGNFPTRGPNPGIASPGIGNFRSTAPRGGFSGRIGGGRSGGAIGR